MSVVLPEQTWLYIHDLELLRSEPSDVVTDDEGNWVEGSGETSVPFRGLLSITNEQEQTLADAKAEQVYATVTAPRNLQVDHTDRIRASGVHPVLDGTYRIRAVRPNQANMRLLLVRWLDLDTQVDSTESP